jgi:hypothetical protein
MIMSSIEVCELLDASIKNTHVQSSMTMMIEAANMAGGGRAALLGCGKGSEIPVHQLAGNFGRIDCVDLDTLALRILEARCKQSEESRRSCRFHNSDLTGLIPQLVPLAREIISAVSDPLACLDQLGTLLNSVQPEFWKPPSPEKYSLVICSAVLTQLQATVRKSVEEIFLDRFPGQASVLSSCNTWRSSLWNFARSLEDSWILHLDSLCSSKGIIYLSDTVRVCWLRRSEPDGFTTEGSWIATRTARLADYLRPSNEILAQDHWPWIRTEAEGMYTGRLYEVQAIIYRAAQLETAKLD